MRSAALYYAGCEDYQNQTNFLEACFLCHKPLGHNCDIYMYRGNTPFCSQECRQEQIEIDESKEKRWKLKTSSSSSKRSSTPDSTTTTTKTGPTNNDVRTGTLVVA